MTNDLISRQAAIDAFTHKWDGMVTSVFDVINSLPSAQPDLDSAYTEGYTAAESKYRKMWDEMQWIKDVQEAYEYWKTIPLIKKPIAKALYEVWKKYDRKERRTDG